jgi:replicative DNA helicase
MSKENPVTPEHENIYEVIASLSPEEKAEVEANKQAISKAENEEKQRFAPEESEEEIDAFGEWGEFTDKLFKPRPPIEYIYKDLIPKGLPGGIFAAGGTGKTFFCIQQVLYGAAGLPFGPLNPVKPLNCVFLCAEDQEKFLLERAESVIRNDNLLKNNFDQIKRNFDIKSLAGVDTRFLEFSAPGNVAETNFFNQVMKKLDQKGELDLIIFDPLVSFWGLPENEAGHGQAMIRCLTRISIETEASVMVAHHVPKDATIESISKGGGRGTSAIYDGLRWAFGMFKVPLLTTQRKSGNKEEKPNPELVKLRAMACDKQAMFSKFFSVKNNHAKELVAVETFKRGKNGVLEPFGAINDFTEQAKIELLDYLKKHAEEFTESELTKGKEGASIRKTFSIKYDLTQKRFKDVTIELIGSGKISVKKIRTTTKTREVLWVP